ncbi:hypothetical protein AEAC466_17460 [Asticcacaulis sp. AC466]|nr:hypothetical protein AEAC466_17460 [Asticcacaulis sp. AC466]
MNIHVEHFGDIYLSTQLVILIVEVLIIKLRRPDKST